MKARNKPVEVDVYRFNGSFNSITINHPPMWICQARLNKTLFWECKDGISLQLFIKTLEGDMLVSNGDYIIKGVHGELYPCKPDIFKETYEVIDDAE